MSARSLPPFDSLEFMLARARARVEELFARYGVSGDQAEGLLVDALSRLVSLHGVLPGAAHRLLSRLESRCRRLRTDEASNCSTERVDYSSSLDGAIARLWNRHLRSERERENCAIVVARLETAWTTGGEPPPLRPSVELLLELLNRARELWATDPQRSLDLARTAKELLADPATGTIRRRLVADLEARSRAYCGNSLRLLHDFRHADRELAAAQSALSRGTRDPRERAELLPILATLRRDQSRFSEALRLLQQTAAIHRWAGDRHREGETFMRMATLHAYSGEPELAVPLGERALALLDRERAPLRFAGAAMNMAHHLNAAGRSREARERLPDARRLVATHGTASNLRGLKWIEGQIAFALGERQEGERLLLEVRDEYVQVGDRYHTALVALELAAEYLDQGRSRDALRMAEETVPIFQSLEIHREILAALIALARAIELETANAGLVRELIQRLEDTRDGPPGRAEKPS